MEGGELMAGDGAIVNADKPLVVGIKELAHLLKTSERTIKKRLAAGAFPIPEVRGIDSKHRWSRALVQQFVDQGGVIPSRRKKAA
jgi:hypothetical protein